MATKIASLAVEIGVDSSKLEAGLKATKTQLSGIGKEAETAGSKIGAFAGGFAKFAAVGGITALGAAFVSTVKSAAELETTFGKIAALTDTPKSAIAGLRDEVLKLGTEIPVSANEMSKALYFISSSGIKGADAMKVLEVSSKAAAAGLGDTQVIADAVTSALNAYGLGADKATKITDILVATVREGKGEPAELAGSLGKILPIAAAAGVSMEQVAAAMATMTRTGMNADEAATSLRGTIGALMAPGKQAADALASIGLTTEDVASKLKGPEGLVGVLQLLMERTGGNVETLDAIIPNIRALTGVLSAAGSQGAEYARILESMNNAAGTTDAAFASMSDTMEFKLKKAQNSLEALGTAIITGLLPGLGQAADAVTVLLTAQDKLVGAVKGVGAEVKASGASYTDYKNSVVGAARAADLLSKSQYDYLMSTNDLTGVRQELLAGIGLQTEAEYGLEQSMSAVARGAENQAGVYSVLDAAMRGSAGASAAAGEAAGNQAIMTEEAAKKAAQLAEKTAEATAANLDFVESFKNIDALSLARVEMERLTELMKSDPANIEAYKAAYVELQREFGLVTPASEAAAGAFEILSGMHLAGALSAGEYKTALDNLKAASADGVVSANELGLSLASVSTFAKIAQEGIGALNEVLSQIERDIRIQLSIGIDQGATDIPNMGHPTGAAAPAPATPAAALPKPAPRRGGAAAASGADFIVPPGYPRDSFNLGVTSGERVLVEPQGSQSSSTTNNISINIAGISRDYPPQQAGDEIINRLRSRGLVA